MAISSGTSNASIRTFSLGRSRTEYSTSKRASLSSRGSCIELLPFHSTGQMQLDRDASSRDRTRQFRRESSVQLAHDRAGESLFEQLPSWEVHQEFLHVFFVLLSLEAAHSVD